MCIITELYNDETLKGYVKKMSPNNHEEAFSQLMLDVMTKIPKDRLSDLKQSKELNYYVVGMARNMIVNPSSPFNKHFNENKMLSYDAILDCDDDNIEKLEFLIDEAASVEEIRIEEEREDGINSLLSQTKEWLAERTRRVDRAYYDEILFNKYFTDKLTYREISKATRIPLSEIYNGVTNVQEIVQTKFKNDYERIIN